MDKKYLFNISTSIGFNISTTQDYWNLIQIKHPEVKDKLLLIKQTLKMPDLVTRSKIDKAVLLFYKKINGYWLCVVAKISFVDGFIITTYITDKIKEGEKVWEN